jgi:hypothetical protein
MGLLAPLLFRKLDFGFPSAFGLQSSDLGCIRTAMEGVSRTEAKATIKFN